jgi:hypothetical protein
VVPVDLKHLPDSASLPKAWIKLSLMLAVALVLMVGGVLMVRDSGATGWWVPGFFALCAAVFAWGMLGGSGVTLTRDSFSVRTLFKTMRYDWKNVSEFSHARVGRTHLIVFNDLTQRDGVLAKMNRFTTGHNSGFPAGFIGGSLDAACATLNAFRARALSRP